MILYPLFTATTALVLLLHSQAVLSQAPSNDECVNAIVIPSDTTLLPYISPVVDFQFATYNVNDPPNDCNNFNVSNWRTVWYKWEPNAVGIYAVSIDKIGLFKVLESYRGSDCTSLVKIGCEVAFDPFFDTRFLSNETYYFKVASDPFNAAASQNVRLFVNATKPPPASAVCTNAIEVQIEDTVTGSLDFTTVDLPVPDVTCGNFLSDAPTLWYKVTNTDPSSKVVTASTCNLFTTIDTVITVFQGSDSCTALNSTCVGGNDESPSGTCDRSAVYQFIAAPSTTYYVAVQVYRAYGDFAMSLEISSSYFTVVDSTSDQTIGLLQGVINYNQISSSNLNIEATFDNGGVQSVLVKYDNKRSRCETKPPYSVFKDKDGDFFDNTIQTGNHEVIATSYLQPNCRGQFESTMAQNFFVSSCSYDLKIYQVSQGTVLYELDPFVFGATVESLPCDDINIEAVLTCGFEIKEVQLKLRRAGFLGFLVTAKEQTEFNAPYYLFSNKGDVINKGTINAGTYVIDLSVNGIVLDETYLGVTNDCS